MYIDPLLPLFARGPKQYAAWPKRQRPARVEYAPLSDLLLRSHEGDAHVSSYSVPEIRHRLGTTPPAYAHRPVPMCVYHWDIDCAASHRAMGGSGAVAADDTWWHATRAKIERLLAAHPGGFAYRTRGGAHIIYRLPVPHIIEDGAGEIAWKRLYLAALAYLAERFDLIGDPSISDWTRLVRLPHVTRDGRFNRAETLGRAHAVGAFDLDLDDAARRAGIDHARGLVDAIPAWAPALRILAGNALPPSRRPRPAKTVEPRAIDAAGWEALAADLGRALQAHHGRHLVHLALAGACYARGVPLDRGPSLAAAICAASGETDDRPQVWETTAEKVRAGAPHTGFEHLARHWPDLAAIVDAALPAGGGARSARDELDARGRIAAIPAEDAAATVRATIENARPGLQVVRVTEGAGKTRAAAEVVRARTIAVGDAARVSSGDKTVFVASSHAVAAEVAEALRGTRAEYLRSVLAVPGPHDGHGCAFHVPLSRLVGAGHDVRTWCEGRGMGRNGADSRCPKYDECPARAGTVVRLDGSAPDAPSPDASDAPSPATKITVHALLGAALGWCGDDALLLIDEDPAAIEAVGITRADLDHAVASQDLYATTEGWRFPMLRALAAGLERGELLDGAGQLEAVFARGVEALAGDTAWEADVAARYTLAAPVDPSALLREFAIRSVWYLDKRDPEAPRWRRRGAWAPRPSPRERARVFAGSAVPRMERASRTIALVGRLAAGVVRAAPEGVVGHAERAVAAVEVSHEDATRRVLRGVIASPAVAVALHRHGPTVLLDATADVAVLSAVAEGDVPVVDVCVDDGALVTRSLLYWSGASRKNTLGGDDGIALRVRWDEGLGRYLRAALTRVLDAGARRLAIFTWKPLSLHLRAVAAGQIADPVAEEIFAWVRSLGATVDFGHYGAARGRNDWKDCDGLVSIGDPRSNVGSSRAVAAVLGLAESHAAIYRRATAAEVSQVSGRLRAPWRTTGAIHVHVGTVAPDAWDQRAEVLELPRGVADGIAAEDIAVAVFVHGSQRLGGAAAGVSERTARAAAGHRVNEDTVTLAQCHTLGDAGNPLPEGCHRPGNVTPSKNTYTVAPCRVCDTPESQANPATDGTAPTSRHGDDHPQHRQRALIAAAGGAAEVARVLGVSRPTAYHWAAGKRAMPPEQRDALQRHLTGRAAAPAAPAADHAAPPAAAPRFEVPVVRASSTWASPTLEGTFDA